MCDGRYDTPISSTTFRCLAEFVTVSDDFICQRILTRA